MYEQEKIMPYGEKSSKSEQVRKMFNHIAHSYDTLNHTLSLGFDKGWRRKGVRKLSAFKPKHILDIATGTGDLAILMAQELKPESIVAADISESMMEVGRQKIQKLSLEDVITFRHEDCMHLSFEDNIFDAVTCAYGVRNFQDLDQGLSEIFRVLKPGGHLMILELSSPHSFHMKPLFWIYAHIVMPIVGRLISKDDSAYVYLPSSMNAFPQGETMENILKEEGFKDISWKRMLFQVCTLYVAKKPQTEPMTD